MSLIQLDVEGLRNLDPLRLEPGSGINFIVTILKRRAPGMIMMRMPPFTWTAFCSSILMAFAFPALTVRSEEHTSELQSH